MEPRKHTEVSEQELAAFEQKLRTAMRYRPAPAGLKARVLAHARERRSARHGWGWLTLNVQRVAASVLMAAALAGVAGGFAVHHQKEEHRKGEQARDQVMTAFRITNHALNRVGDRLADGR